MIYNNPSREKLPGSDNISLGLCEKGILHLRTICSGRPHGLQCSFDPKIEVPLVEGAARERGVTQVAMLGGCVWGQHDLVADVTIKLQRRGIDFRWIDYRAFEDKSIPENKIVSSAEFVLHYLGKDSFSYWPRCWDNVTRAAITLPLLVAQAERMRDVQRKVEAEQKLLEEYPIVRRVKVMRESRFRLFGGSTQEVREVSVVAFNTGHTSCQLFTKSESIQMEIPWPNGRLSKESFVLGFSSPLQLKWGSDEVPHYGLLTEPGVWYALPHPRLDPANPDLKFEPLLQRLRKHPPQKHRSYGDHKGGDCKECGLTGQEWQKQPICLVRSRNLKDGYWEGPAKS